MADDVMDSKEKTPQEREAVLSWGRNWSWHNWVGVIGAVVALLLLTPLFMASIGSTSAQVFLMHNSPIDLENLVLITFGLVCVVYVYAVWLQWPREFAFFNPTWWVATCFGIGYIPRYFKKWWNYFIAILAAVLITASAIDALPVEIAVGVVAFAICLKGAGTLGTLFACVLVVIIAFLPGSYSVGPPRQEAIEMVMYGFLALTAMVTITGTVASQIYVNRTGRQDPSEVVIDEVAGMFVAVIIGVAFMAYLIMYVDPDYIQMVRLALYFLLAMFVFFRVFDIFKPYPVNRLEKAKPEGWGIMVDDLMAGVYAGFLFIIVFLILEETGLLYDFLNGVAMFGAGS